MWTRVILLIRHTQYYHNVLLGNADCLRTLLSFGGCNVSAVDQYGDTPRKIAQVYNHLQCIEVIDEHLRKTNT